jgi:2-succinyl-6-hydroxy-2,4-cyclohexadiene-1-carboxylate synthase
VSVASVGIMGESMAETLLLLHGFTHTGASWEPVIQELGERYRAIAPDLRGHGTSGAMRPVSLEAVIDDVIRGMPDSFALAGYSMGGRIALHLALAHPERVSSLVTVGASPGIASDADRAARLTADEALARRFETLRIEDLDVAWSQTAVLADQPAAVRAAVRADRLRSAPGGLAAALRGLGTGALPSLWNRLDGLAMPCRFLAGERDAKFTAIAREMAASAPDATAAVIPDAGHAAHLEAPAAVAAEFA